MTVSFGGGVYAWSSVKYLRSSEMAILFAQIASAVTVNDSTYTAAIRLLPLVFFQVAGTILSGALMNKIGYYVPWYFAGGTLSLIGGALFFTVSINTPTSAIYGYSVLVGLGCGLYVQAGYPIAQLKVPPAEIPQVVAFIGYGQITGITLALTISNSIYLNEATNKIADILPAVPRDVVQQAISGTGGPFFATLKASDRDPVLRAIVRSIGNVYGMVIAAGALSIVLALFMKRERLHASSAKHVDHEKEATGKQAVSQAAEPAA
ncbi:MAG: hypothetical protein Q9160_006026 [Pyrenula sp. 1 TL-2023]